MSSRYDSVSMLSELFVTSQRTRMSPPPTIVPDAFRWSEPEAAPIEPLPAPVVSGVSLGQLLVRRTSTRDFADSTIHASQLATLLAIGARKDAVDWAEEIAAGLPLRLLACCWRVEGLKTDLPSVFEYDADQHGMRRLGRLPPSEQATSLYLQQEFGNAAAVITVVGNLAGACARHGQYGHRLLLVRAGAAAHRGWLAGLSMGLVGTVFAGIIDRPLRELAQVDGYITTPLFALAVGQPV